MKRLLGIVAVIVTAFVALGAVGWWRGMFSLPFGPNHRELAAKLRDRGPVAVAGGIPFGLPRDETPLVDIEQFPQLAAALRGRDGVAVANALRAAHLDGLLVRTDHAEGAPGTMLRTLSDMAPSRGVGATYLDETAALYEARDDVQLDPHDAARLIAVARLVLQGAVPPADTLFPLAVRRAYPTEVAVIVRDGHEPILWRAVRGGSIARALIDATYAVLDRWNTRQQQRFGPLREAILAHPITIAIFHDKGELGGRTPAFLRRAVNPRAFAIGYNNDQRSQWEYALPPSPWAPMGDPVQTIRDLAHDRNVPPPGWLRPEITVYRFRAYQLVENEPLGAVQIFEGQ